MLAPVRVTSSEFADGRRNEVASPDSEQIELAGAVPHRRNSVSVEQIQEEKEEKDEAEKNERFHTCEFRYGKYLRTLSFDSPIKSEDAHAQYQDGVLTITIPKQEIKERKPKIVEIK